MSHDARIRWKLLIVCAIGLALIVIGLSGCASIKSAAAPAGGAAGGAAVGAIFPPFGPIVGAAVGAVMVHAIAENASLRSGETVGEGAIERELARWKGRAIEASNAASMAESAWSGLKTAIGWGLLGLLGWLHFRNREGWKKHGYWHGVWIHGILGGAFGTHRHRA